MGITVQCKTKAKSTLKLFNTISSYLFEQEFDELKGYPMVKEALKSVKKELAKIIKDKEQNG